MKIICADCSRELKENEEYMEYKDGHCKCKECHQKNPEGRFQETEVWSRVVGYFRPLKTWGPGKYSEFQDRVEFELDKTL